MHMASSTPNKHDGVDGMRHEETLHAVPFYSIVESPRHAFGSESAMPPAGAASSERMPAASGAAISPAPPLSMAGATTDNESS